MTGFGTATASDGQRVFMLEVRAVNHKFCDVRVRLPRELVALEGPIQSRIRNRVSRGRVDVSVDATYHPDATASPRVNLALARGYRDAFIRIAESLAVEPEVTLGLVANAPGVIESPSTPGDLEALAPVLYAALDEAVDHMNAMRDREGSALGTALEQHLGEVESQLQAIKEEIPQANGIRRVRLEQRLRELLGDRTLDPSRLSQEVAILVDRADVSEEVARLDSHVIQFRRQLEADEPVGRKLDFLLQEMHREANTIGSKSASARISHLVVDLKSAVERIREQVQNVE